MEYMYFPQTNILFCIIYILYIVLYLSIYLYYIYIKNPTHVPLHVCIGFWSSWVDNSMGKKMSGWPHLEHSSLWLYSTWKPIISGVPKEFVLGPVMLNIFINDLEKDKEYTHVTFSSNSSSAVTEENLHRLAEWVSRTLMKYSMDKCKVQALRRKNLCNDQPGAWSGLKNCLWGSKQIVLLGPLRSLPNWNVWSWWINAEIVYVFFHSVILKNAISPPLRHSFSMWDSYNLRFLCYNMLTVLLKVIHLWYPNIFHWCWLTVKLVSGVAN